MLKKLCLYKKFDKFFYFGIYYICSIEWFNFYVVVRIIIIFLVYRLNKVCYENLLKVGSYCYDDVKIKLFNVMIKCIIKCDSYRI